MAHDTQSKPAFSAVLTPHRSLIPRGFVVVMSLIAGISFVIGAIFFLMGAWPVLGFLGLDVVLIYWAFRASYSSADMCETVDVTDNELILRRMRRRYPAEEYRFTRGWVSIDLEEDADREMIGDLSLRTRGKRLVFGRFLAPQERQTLALALRTALARPHI